MTTMPKKDTLKPRARPSPPRVWKLQLYVAGQTAAASRAIANLTVLCDEHLKGRYRIEVIDLLEHPELARGAQIVAIPTLVIKLPKMVRTVIGDLSNVDRALIGMALQPVIE